MKKIPEPTLQEIVDLAVELGRKEHIQANWIRWPSWASPPECTPEFLARIEELKAMARAKLRKRKYMAATNNENRRRKFRINPDPNAPRVPAREKEVLNYLKLGMATPEIAERMGISKNTVNTYVGRLLRRTGISNRRRLVVRAIKWGKV